MKKVWAVVDGEYSDYHVIGVFSSAKNANLVRAIVGGDVAEWTLDPAVKEINAGLTPYYVIMLADGTVESCKPTEISSYSLTEFPHTWDRPNAPAYAGEGIPAALCMQPWAKSKEHAIKITNETRIRMIASGEWK